ncbi:hypothetical protein QBC35DRAFT_488383 [Podospora australis]|uniref:Uncharacterized protein n=1 Tax=Podospora australis TaxID=1536484 RepID=A0AAN6X068_9PEZI|nr:hypothetical protein QBC35DRAFT_488383 [Podospora australis]
MGTVCSDAAQISNACGFGHAWCSDCLRQVILAATRNTTDPAVFPPRCCDVNSPLLLVGVTTALKNHPLAIHLSDEELENYRHAVESVQARKTARITYDVQVLQPIILYSPQRGQFCPTCATLASRSSGCNHIT